MPWPADLALALPTAGSAESPVALLLVVVALIGLPAGPAEPTALAAGLLAIRPELPLEAGVVAAAAGMAGGDLLSIGLAHRLSRRRPVDDHGARHARRPRADRARHLLARQADRPALAMLVLAGGRFLPGLRTPTAAAAGLAGLPIRRCVLAVSVGSLAWAAVWVSAGRLGASTLDAAGVAPGDLVGDGALLGTVAVLTLLVVGLILPRLGRDAERLRPCSVSSIRPPDLWRAEPSMHS
ncbi:VTT domain-containing protein [Nesterenkonia halobia]|uniref:VTT domain-containing protein n=1 Tax=Nesterenkonia halobia TaxID=37922 RepID=A0ABP6R776_9MICC